MDDPQGNRKTLTEQVSMDIYIFSIVKMIKREKLDLLCRPSSRSRRVLPSTGGSGRCICLAWTPRCRLEWGVVHVANLCKRYKMVSTTGTDKYITKIAKIDKIAKVKVVKIF